MVDVSEAFLDRLNESTAQAIKAIKDAKEFIAKQEERIKRLREGLEAISITNGVSAEQLRAKAKRFLDEDA